MASEFQSVANLPVADAATAAAIKAAALVPSAGVQGAVAPPQQLVTKPGTERWPVKTGVDADISKVKQLIVDTTVEELVRIPPPADITPVTGNYPAYQDKREMPVETTIWRLQADIIALKLEADGDYHLVLQGDSGETMIGEIPTPNPPFVKAPSPWNADIQAARKAADTKLLSKVNAAGFMPMEGILMPPGAFSTPQQPAPSLVQSIMTPGAGVAAPGATATFRTKVTPTKARITGVGFFDKVHGQSGVSVNNGIELHPILKIEWI